MGLFTRRTLLVLVVVCAVVALPATASAAFSSQLPVSGGDAAVKGPGVAQDSASSQFVVWVRAADRHVMARRVSDDGSMGAIADLSGEPSKSDSTTAAVATADPAGNVTVSWMRGSDQHVVAVRIAKGGAPGGVIDVSQGSVAGSSQSNAAADGLGNVHFVWRNGSDSHVTTRTLSPAGALGAVTDISVIDGEAALWGTAPNVAADAAGSSYFTYHRNTDCHIMLRVLSTGGALGPAIDVSQTPDKAVGDTSPAIATAGGNALLVWHRDGDQFDHADDTVYFNFVLGGTTAGTPTALSAAGDVSMMGIGAAGGPDGAFGVSWQGRTSGAVWYRGIGSSGVALGAPLQLSAGASRADAAPAISIGPSAGTAVAWSADADSAVNLTSSTGTYSPPVKVSAPAVTLAKKSISLKRGTVTLKLTCSASAGVACSGRVKLTDTRRKRSWGSARFTAAHGATVKVKLKLTKRAKKQLRSSGRLKGYLGVSVDGGAPTGTSVKLRGR
ncbi:MAG: hypothetical protein JHC98_02765 [Thermoleophilaceae bacterium]|nr:hypothetical protein [Thermoleophilaceae bacterium]